VEAFPHKQRGAGSGLQSASGASVAAARDIFQYALDATSVSTAMERRITCDVGSLVVDGHNYTLGGYERVFLVAIGKASVPMASSLLRILGGEAKRVEGIVVGVAGEALPENIQVFHGGHPSPTEASLAAAGAILRLLETATERDLVMFLVSGGGSSMVEQMLRPEIPLADIAAIHKALVESGAPIAAINAVRKHLSAVKGGRLAAAAAPAEQLTIFVSDVPVGELDALASGPTLPDRSTVADVRRIVAEYGLADSLPKQVAGMLPSEGLAETPKPGDTAFARSRWSVLLDSASLEEAAAKRAEELGWTVTVDSSCDDWSAKDAAEYLVQRLESLKAARPEERVCLISAGEVTVRVPANAAGRGGRNQHFALLCAEQIAGCERVVLSAGSDGVDGNSPSTGAVVNGSTIQRAEAAGYPIAQALAAFDSYGLMSLMGDAITTGPTGNNLRDLRILLAP
jgi:glycerate 2-kinase